MMKEFHRTAFNEMTPYQYSISMQLNDGKTGRKLETVQAYIGFRKALTNEQCNNLSAGMLAVFLEGNVIHKPKPGDQIGLGIDSLFDDDLEEKPTDFSGFRR